MGQSNGIIRKDVHPESYVTQVIMLSIGTVVMGDVVAGLVRSGEGDSLDERITELVRIARLALFVPNEERPGRGRR